MLKFLFFYFLFTFSLFSLEIAVVVDNNFPKTDLKKNEIKAIFLNKKRFINGKKILAMNYKSSNPLRVCFEDKMFKISQNRLERYWRKSYYQGKRPPKVISSSAMLFLYLNRVTPAIGYLELKNVPKKLKIIFKIRCDS